MNVTITEKNVKNIYSICEHLFGTKRMAKFVDHLVKDLDTVFPTQTTEKEEDETKPAPTPKKISLTSVAELARYLDSLGYDYTYDEIYNIVRRPTNETKYRNFIDEIVEDGVDRDWVTSLRNN